MDLNRVKEVVFNKNKGRRLLILIVGAFLLGFCYNLLLIPNDLMTGGMSGIAIVFYKVTGLSAKIFIYGMTPVLLIISWIFLGKEVTSRAVIGSILYPLMISLTEPLANFIIPYLDFDSILIPVCLSGCILGFANGIIYREGFNTGGSDILMKLVCKYGKMTEGHASRIVSIIIIAFGAFTLGINHIIYSCALILISSYIVDKIIIGTSNTKLFYIITNKEREIKNFIMDELKAGVTELKSVGGFTKHVNNVLMTVVRTKDYYFFKETILMIDPNAFFIINDCYEVKGGVKRETSGLFQV